MELIIEEVTDNVIAQKIRTLWNYCSDDLETFFDRWVTESQTLCIAVDAEESDPLEGKIYLSFYILQQLVVVASIHAQEISKAFPEIQKLIPPEVAFDFKKYELGNEPYNREIFMEARDETLKPKWDDDLYERVFSLNQGIQIAFSYALTGRAEVVFQTHDMRRFVDDEYNTEEIQKLISVLATQADNKTGWMSTESFSTARPKNSFVPKEFQLSKSI